MRNRADKPTLELPACVARRGGVVVRRAELLLEAGGRIDALPAEMRSHGPAVLVDAFADAYER